METTKYIWMNGDFVPWEEAKIHILTHTLHYGAGAFEGVRAYQADKGTAIFRLKEHTDRLFYSAQALGIKVPYSKDQLNEAQLELLRKNELKQGYLRPIIYLGYGKMGLNPAGVPVDAAIAAWPWGAYLPHDMVDLKISSFIRIHPRSTVADAKICGHYVNSIFAVRELQGTKYHEALLLDFEGNIAEGPGENLFILKNGTLLTPKLGTILKGITRHSVMEIANHLGIEAVEKTLKPEDAYGADEAFFTGTAAEITPIRSIDDHVLGGGKLGPVTTKIKETFLAAVHGKVPEFERWLSYI